MRSPFQYLVPISPANRGHVIYINSSLIIIWDPLFSHFTVAALRSSQTTASASHLSSILKRLTTALIICLCMWWRFLSSSVNLTNFFFVGKCVIRCLLAWFGYIFFLANACLISTDDDDQNLVQCNIFQTKMMSGKRFLDKSHRNARYALASYNIFEIR